MRMHPQFRAREGCVDDERGCGFSDEAQPRRYPENFRSLGIPRPFAAKGLISTSGPG